MNVLRVLLSCPVLPCPIDDALLRAIFDLFRFGGWQRFRCRRWLGFGDRLGRRFFSLALSRGDFLGAFAVRRQPHLPGWQSNYSPPD